MAGLVDRKIKRTEAQERELAEARANMAAEWARRHGARPLADIVCPGGECAITPLHVHPRRAPQHWELVTRAGAWTDQPVFGLGAL